jgi:hypothetical protein
MGDRSEERFSTKHREIRTQAIELVPYTLPRPFLGNVTSLSHWVLIAIFTGDIARDSDREVFDCHGPRLIGLST